MFKRPLLIVTAAVVLVILSFEAALPLWVPAGVGALCLCIVLYETRGDVPVVLICAAALLSAWFSCQRLYAPSALSPAFGEEGTLSGVITDGSADKKTYTLRVIQNGRPGEAVMLRFSEAADFSPGEILRASGRIEAPQGARNPGAFDTARYLRTKAIKAVMWAEGAEKIGTYKDPYCALRRYRLACIQAARDAFGEEDAEIITALTLGTSVSAETRQVFSDAGAAHLLALSGLHIGFLFALIMAGASAAGFGRRGVFIAALVLLSVYTLLTGLSASVLRAVIMCLCLAGAGAATRTYDALSALCLTALFILCATPGQLFSAGFQMSFGAVLAITLFYRPVVWRLGDLGVRGAVAKSLVLSAVATAGTLPGALSAFYTLSLAGLVTNLFLVPLGTLIVALALPVVLLLPTGAVQLAPLVQGPVWVLKTAAGWCARLGFLRLDASRGVWALFILIVLALLCAAGYVRRLRPAALAGAALLIFLLWPQAPRMTVTYLDVGQGNAALVELADGLTLMIDGGGYHNPDGKTPISEKVLLPALRAKGIDHIDAAFITHNHADHAQGVHELLAKIPVRQIYISSADDSGLELQDRVPVKRLSAGGRLNAGACQIEVLGPQPTAPLGQDEQNDHSLVLRLRYNETSFLFTGDATAAEEETLSPQVLNSDVLCVGHHGSRYSSTQAFIDAVSPEIAVISVGRNTYGHPAPQTLERLKESAVYRTDESGAVEVVSDGKNLRVRTTALH